MTFSTERQPQKTALQSDIDQRVTNGLGIRPFPQLDTIRNNFTGSRGDDEIDLQIRLMLLDVTVMYNRGRIPRTEIHELRFATKHYIFEAEELRKRGNNHVDNPFRQSYQDLAQVDQARTILEWDSNWKRACRLRAADFRKTQRALTRYEQIQEDYQASVARSLTGNRSQSDNSGQVNTNPPGLREKLIKFSQYFIPFKKTELTVTDSHER